ncbi:MAG: cytochrome c3 family protein [Bryobacterales bacterium]
MQVTKPQAFLTLVAISVLVSAGWFAVSGQTPQVSPAAAAEKLPLPPPEQPVPFSHKLHVGLGAKCLDCHAIKPPGFTAGYPPAATCMACHAAIKADSPHIQKLAEAEKSQNPVEWVKVYKVPDYVWFAHQTHVADAKVACETCHGPVAEREAIFKEKPTSMVSCMDCHAQHGAPNDCDLCHNPP